MKTALIFSRDRDHIQGHDDWALAPPMRQGQIEYSQLLRRASASKGTNSPPPVEFENVPQQFTHFTFRAKCNSS